MEYLKVDRIDNDEWQKQGWFNSQPIMRYEFDDSVIGFNLKVRLWDVSEHMLLVNVPDDVDPGTYKMTYLVRSLPSEISGTQNYSQTVTIYINVEPDIPRFLILPTSLIIAVAILVTILKHKKKSK